MNTFRLFLLATLLTACGGASTPAAPAPAPEPPPSATPAEFCNQLINTACGYYESCGLMSQEQCQIEFRFSLIPCEEWTGDLFCDDTSLTYDGEAAYKCLEAAETFTCETFQTSEPEECDTSVMCK